MIFIWVMVIFVVGSKLVGGSIGDSNAYDPPFLPTVANDDHLVKRTFHTGACEEVRFAAKSDFHLSGQRNPASEFAQSGIVELVRQSELEAMSGWSRYVRGGTLHV